MNRRTHLASIAGTGTIGVVGCLAGGTLAEDVDEHVDDHERGADERANETEAPVVDAAGLALAPGEAGPISIRVVGADAVRGTKTPASDAVTVAFSEAEFSAFPDGIGYSYPPYWNWSSPVKTVEIAVPVRIADDATPGEYRGTVSAWRRDASADGERTRPADEPRTSEFTVTVASD